MRPIADDLVALVMRPSPGNAEGSSASATIAQQCTIQLAGNFDAVRAKLNGIGNLVELAAKMVQGTDMTFVSAVISVEAPAFLEQLKSHQLMLDLTLTSDGCSQDSATVAKGQEISRIYGDAAALVQSVIEKIGAGASRMILERGQRAAGPRPVRKGAACHATTTPNCRRSAIALAVLRACLKGACLFPSARPATRHRPSRAFVCG